MSLIRQVPPLLCSVTPRVSGVVCPPGCAVSVTCSRPRASDGGLVAGQRGDADLLDGGLLHGLRLARRGLDRSQQRGVEPGQERAGADLVTGHLGCREMAVVVAVDRLHGRLRCREHLADRARVGELGSAGRRRSRSATRSATRRSAAARSSRGAVAAAAPPRRVAVAAHQDHDDGGDADGHDHEHGDRAGRLLVRARVRAGPGRGRRTGPGSGRRGEVPSSSRRGRGRRGWLTGLDRPPRRAAFGTGRGRRPASRRAGEPPRPPRQPWPPRRAGRRCGGRPRAASRP